MHYAEFPHLLKCLVTGDFSVFKALLSSLYPPHRVCRVNLAESLSWDLTLQCNLILSPAGGGAGKLVKQTVNLTDPTHIVCHRFQYFECFWEPEFEVGLRFIL